MGGVKKGEMYMIGEREEYSPEYVGRLLRFMAGGPTKKYPDHLPEIRDEMYKGKRGQKLVRYAPLDMEPIIKVERKILTLVEYEDGRREMVFN